MKYKTLLFFILFINLLIARDGFAPFLKQQDSSFNQYRLNLKTEFEKYKEAYEEAFNKYKKNILKKFPEAEISTKTKFVQYDKSFKSKSVVDFKNKELKFEIIAKNEIEAKEKIKKYFKKLLNEDIKSAYESDFVESKVSKKLKLNKKINSNKKIISDALTKKQIKSILNFLSSSKLKREKYKNKIIFSINAKLPNDFIVKKAKTFKKDVFIYARKTKIPPNLIYAIIQTESSFNPMARSYIPAFGLMQIVPKTAGADTAKFLYGKRKIFSSSYLYNSTNNIKIGSYYLHILYFKYLKNIKNKKSRYYCTIAAYNTGAGNVAKAFIGNYNIYKASKKINKMSQNQVYKTLMRNLPYRETKNYLYKVDKRANSFYVLLASKKL